MISKNEILQLLEEEIGDLTDFEIYPAIEDQAAYNKALARLADKLGLLMDRKQVQTLLWAHAFFRSKKIESLELLKAAAAANIINPL